MSRIKRGIVWVLDRLINAVDGAQEGMLDSEGFRGRAELLRKAAKLCDGMADALDDLRRKRAAQPPEIP